MLNAEIRSQESRPVASPLFDEDGFLLNQALWSERLAAEIADEEGVGALTEKHWQVLQLIRDKFFRIGALPNLRRVCRETAIPKREVYSLFGSCLTIWRVAGLPNPGEEAKSYLS